MIGPSKHIDEPLRNKAFIGAYRKGQRAFREGKPQEGNPYRETRGGRHLNVITYSRAFQNCWLEGWLDALNGENGYPEKSTEDDGNEIGS